VQVVGAKRKFFAVISAKLVEAKMAGGTGGALAMYPPGGPCPVCQKDVRESRDNDNSRGALIRPEHGIDDKRTHSDQHKCPVCGRDQ
jgi:hypothetical protein